MPTLTTLATVTWFLVMLICSIHAYPLADETGAQVPADLFIPRDVPDVDKRKMGWRSCNGFFKWRCGITRVVLSKKLGEYRYA